MDSEYVVRNASKDDFAGIMQLIHSPGIKFFGNIRPKYNAKSELFKCYQSHRLVVLENASSTSFIAYAEFRNFPSIGALPADSWLEWLNHRYCIDLSISLLNTLFFTFAIYKSEHPITLKNILREVFYSENKILNVITLKMPKVSQRDYYDESFTDLENYGRVFYPREFNIDNNFNTQSLFIINRYDILPKLTYRKAMPEDNDDIIEIQEQDLPELREELGDYYIAEELMRRDEDADKSYLIVAEIENQKSEHITAGFIWLSTDIDIKYYVENYEVELFGNLINFNDTEPHNFQTMLVSSIQAKAEVSLFTADALDDLQATTILGGLQLFDSGLSVASLGKVKVSSYAGTIVSSSSARFYQRESIFHKFYFIFQKLHSPEYYTNVEQKHINFFYNIGENLTDEEAVQNSANVFILKYIGIDSIYPINRLFNFLICAFCAFPDRDYCIMAIPKSATPVRSHMEVLKYFMPVAQRPSKITNLEDIYITHRSTIHGEISLYPLVRGDVEIIQNLAAGAEVMSDSDSSVSHISKINVRADIEFEYKIINDIMNDVLNNELSEFSMMTIRCGNSTKAPEENTVIGFVAMRKFINHHQLHYHYHLPKYDSNLKHDRAEIISLRLHPLFQIWSDIIFRDLARKTNYFDFYFVSPRMSPSLSNDLKTHMMLIEPNHVKKCWRPDNLKERDNTFQSKIKVPFNDFYFDHLILFRHKLKPSKWYGNTTKLVIVGFTEETKAFLRQLAFQWNTKDHRNSEMYTCVTRLEVTVIARPGVVEAEYDNLFVCPYCLDGPNCYLSYKNNACYVRDVTTRMDMRYWVHFVPSWVTSINRKQKFLRCDNSCEVHYDTLLLMCHRNFSLNSKLPVDEKGREPANFLEINTRIDKFLLFYKCRVLTEELPRNHIVLVYGSNLATYECINFLVTHGVNPTRITLVLPHQFIGNSTDIKLKCPYKDTKIQYILEEMCTDLGITIKEDMSFSHWVQHETGSFIMEVVFKKFPTNVEHSFDCDIFVSFADGHMSQRNKNWYQDGGIRMSDNKLLVDQNYRTNDPNIYAIGKHIEMIDEPNYQYRYTSERESAQKLIEILKLGIPTGKPFQYRYSLPLFFQAQLPLGYYITKVTMPRRYLLSQVVIDQICALTTYKNQTFCRVVLGQNMMIEEIVVVTKNSTRLDFLEYFCGKHESLLNNLKARYKAGAIKCFLKFFQEPWTELIMHEKFEDLQTENHNLLKPLVLSTTMKLGRAIFQDITEKEFFKVNKRFLEQSLINFLRENRRDFHHQFALPEDFLNMEDTT